MGAGKLLNKVLNSPKSAKEVWPEAEKLRKVSIKARVKEYERFLDVGRHPTTIN